jgi:hypothetical protein
MLTIFLPTVFLSNIKVFDNSEVHSTTFTANCVIACEYDAFIKACNCFPAYIDNRLVNAPKPVPQIVLHNWSRSHPSAF